MLRFVLTVPLIAPLSLLAFGIITGLTGSPPAPKAEEQPDSRLLAGAASIDITPPDEMLPVIVNGSFTERAANQVHDRLHARAICLQSGATTLALVVVDSCMMPRALIDGAKAMASEATGIAKDHILVSATHTHSAPSVFACLGSRADPEYSAFLPGKIAEAIIAAHANLRPAEAGWTIIDNGEQVSCRRWIRRPDQMLTDPFGETNVRANMHPGHLSEAVTGPSGPEDPTITVLGIRTIEGTPLAVLGSFGMHYFSTPALSSDYFGRAADLTQEALGAGDAHPFVAAFANGTSGDMWLADYSQPAPEGSRDIEAYSRAFSLKIVEAWDSLDWHARIPLEMAEALVPLGYRVPSPERLQWARDRAQALGGALPTSREDIYAMEAIHLHELQRTELVVQALRVGDLAITALPNEVYALTGLKIKHHSPFPVTMNISLANGAEGYIPPPEQHLLGGYNTWPARSAGLQVDAEPILLETILALLEKISGRGRALPEEPSGNFPKTVLDTDPYLYWRFADHSLPTAHDRSPNGHDGTLDGGLALFLEGPPGEEFSGPTINRAVHLAGGRVVGPPLPSPLSYSVSLWFWNALPGDARAVTGYLFSAGDPEDDTVPGDHLGIGGSFPDSIPNRLFVYNGNAQRLIVQGKTDLRFKGWHHLVMVREGQRVTLYLDGNPTPELSADLPSTLSPEAPFFVGGRSDDFSNFEGKIDEFALWDRPLSAAEAAALYQSSQPAAEQSPPASSSPPEQPAYPPLSPAESHRSIEVPEGFVLELVAAEPLVLDPVAFDWDASGRLWVVEMADYPTGNPGANEPGGRVRILSDDDGDGRYDSSQLFATGLNFPTGISTWRDGVLVTAAPHLIFLKDTTGDGVADFKEILLEGFGEGNQQLRVNGLRLGLDNTFHLAAGGHHRSFQADTKITSILSGEELVLGSRDASYDPLSGKLQPQSGPSQFGRERDDFGRWFGSQNSHPLWHYVLPDRYIARNPHHSVADSRIILVPPNPPIFPLSPSTRVYHGAMQSGQVTSACGQTIYRDSLLFQEQGPLNAFVCEPANNLVIHYLLEEDGVSFTASRPDDSLRREFIASTDTWFRPVMVRTGPDGALYVADMYRAMIEHPHWIPEDARARLAPRYRLGEDRGRIYRIGREDTARRTAPPLVGLTSRVLAGRLDHPNGWVRDKIHSLLLADGGQHPPTDVLAELATSASHPAARAHALSLLHHHQQLDPTVLTNALTDPSPGVRENALRLAEHGPFSTLSSALATLLDDPSEKVLLQLALSLGEFPDPEAGEALATLMVDSSDKPWIVSAALTSATPHLPVLISSLAAAPDPSPHLAKPLAKMAFAAGRPELLAPLARRAFPDQALEPQGQHLALARPLLEAAGGTMPPGIDQQRFSHLVEHAGSLARSPSAPPADRLLAAQFLSAIPGQSDTALPCLAGLLDPSVAPDTQAAAIGALAGSGHESVPSLILARWQALPPSSRSLALDSLLARETWAIDVLSAVRAGDLAASDIDAARRARIRSSTSAKVRELATSTLPEMGSPDRQALIKRFSPALELAGDATRGRAVFLATCVSCHQLDGIGLAVGPDLASFTAHPPEKLLSAILDPSADIQPGYAVYECALTSGEQLQGFIVSETASSITLKLPSGSTRTVLRPSIRSMRSIGTSLMPEGLEEGLDLQSMADLLTFISGPSR